MTSFEEVAGTADGPPIADYALLADCHSAALVSRAGSVDWCCMPRIDSGSIFGRLLGWANGGYWRIAPLAEHRVRRRYLEDSMVLETSFETDDGTVRLIDFMPMREGGREQPYRQLLRVIVGDSGEVAMRCEIAPRFDYAAAAPFIRDCEGGAFQVLGGSDGLLVSTDMPLSRDGRQQLSGTVTIGSGERRHVALVYAAPPDLDDDRVAAPSARAIDERLEETLQWWRRWARQLDDVRFDPALSRRSALLLKALTYAPSGAMAAAATTSLPEVLGGGRNWDYRYTWIRDSVFAARSLLALGVEHEADGFRRFVERAAAGRASEVQVVYGVDGRHRLPEVEIPELAGYRGSAPVRVGNAAVRQQQLDINGELLDLAYRWRLLGHPPDEQYWEFIVDLVEQTIDRWREPDRGLWEVRGAPRHFVHSKVLAWTALDSGLRLAEDLGADVGHERWRRERDEIRRLVERRGYDPRRGVFVQAFDEPTMDAALLLLPVFRFVDFDDPRMVRTADAVREELTEDGLLRRYPAHYDDDLEGREGVFVACTVWLAECLARQGRRDEAQAAYANAAATANDLGLFAEEYDVERGELLGNFPQGLTHLSQIAAAVALGEPTS
jgi:GH15 family glucan-1,4-alpha-glucosidase